MRKHFYLLKDIFLSKSVYYTYKARENQNKTFRVIYTLSGLHRLSNGYGSDRFASALLNHKKLFVIQMSTFFEIEFFTCFAGCHTNLLFITSNKEKILSTEIRI